MSPNDKAYVIIAHYADHSGDAVIIGVWPTQEEAVEELARIEKCDPAKSVRVDECDLMGGW